MNNLDFWFTVAAVVFFVLAGVGVTAPKWMPRLSWIPLGYACLVMTLLV